VQVVAPCTMQAGYTFMTQYGDAVIPVTVPPGGVQEGQLFTIPFPSKGDLSSEITPFILNHSVADEDSQLGKWTDSLFDCFRYGPCHVHLLNAVFCPQLLMAQILTRLKMNWLGERSPDNEWQQTFRVVLLMTLSYWTVYALLAPPSPIWIQDEQGRIVRLPNQQQVPALQVILYNLLSLLFGLYTLIVLTKLRRIIRLRYEIPVQFPRLGPWEDFCCAFWCGCCSVAQMARQTCEYDQQSSACCSPTGFGTSLHHPILVV
jgi:Cys-rich protein (TIGR01571 family)